MLASTKKLSDNKAIFGWVMYDFANSSFTTLIVTFIYATYFTKAIAADVVSGTTYWGRAVTITALVVALLSPIMGTIADQRNQRKTFLVFFTFIAVVSSTMLYTVLPGQVLRALVWFTIGNIAFEMAGVFYNAFLPAIAPPEKIGRISGLGWGIGYFGGLAAMFIAMIGFVNPEVPWFGLAKDTGENIRATNLLVAAWFALFSLPIILLVKDTKKAAGERSKRPYKAASPFKALLKTFRDIKQYRQIVRFLLARLIYNDGLITIFAFGGIYAAGTFNFSFEEIMVFGIVLNIAAGLGALAFGWLDDLLGSRKTIFMSLIGLVSASLIAIVAPNKTLFWVAGIMVGLFSGPNQSASRSLMAKFVPPAKQNEFFGFFAFSGKSTAFAGPLLLSLLTDLFNSQRAGMSIVIAFFTIGALLLTRVDEKAGIDQQSC